MRKQLLFLMALLPFAVSAQVGTFEGQPLPTADTYYVNYSMPGKDVGFNELDVHFPCVYDTSFGGYWVSGFAYSNKTDSVTSGYGNQYSAKAGAGDNGSSKYVVAYGAVTSVKRINGAPWFHSFYITNSTYSYNSMKNGDAFAKKFGGASGNDSDWFKVTIRGYRNGQHSPNDSVDFYLADFRFADNSQDYILKDWRQVDLTKFTISDSLTFTLSSSDTGSFGINTPLYFCLDDIQMWVEGVDKVSFEQVATLSPNPANNILHLDIKNESVKQAVIIDAMGRRIAEFSLSSGRKDINISMIPPGQYLLQLSTKDGNAVTRFVRQ